MTRKRLQEIETRSGKATTGPWRWHSDALVSPGEVPDRDYILWPSNVPGNPENWRERLGSCGTRAEDDAEHNAALIAACREDIPALVTEVRRLYACIRSIRECVECRINPMPVINAALADENGDPV